MHPRQNRLADFRCRGVVEIHQPVIAVYAFIGDVFVNVTGGIKITDTAADLALAAAIISSFLDIAISSETCFSGEIGLSGEIRPVRQINNRIEEAHRLGFKKIISSPQKKDVKTSVIQITEVKRLVKYLTLEN